MKDRWIRVPATSANLGPGFDSLGLALTLYDDFRVGEASDVTVHGCPEEHANEDNLFVRAFRRGVRELGLPFRGITVRFDAQIPIARGLGSSSACIVAGLLAAQAAAEDAGTAPTLDRQAILDLASEIEGHPDNVCPALLGGFAVSVQQGRRVHVCRTDVEPDLQFNALVPPFKLETIEARKALPATIGFGDAVFNAGHAAMTAAAFFSKDYAGLTEACQDRLHQPYRAALIDGYETVAAAARSAGALAVFLSGAGPTIMAVCRAGQERFADAMADGLAGRHWQLMPLRADNRGAQVRIVQE